MTLNELIVALTDLIDEGVDGDSIVLFAHQPRYPLQCSIGGPVVYCAEDDQIEQIESDLASDSFTQLSGEEREAAEEEIERLRESRQPIVYLNEVGSAWGHGQRELSPYAPREAWGD